MWPFNKKKPASLDPLELRNRLIAAAASGSQGKLRSECRTYKDQVTKHLDVISKVPDDVPKDDGSAQGNQLASEGKYSDALEKYHEASDTDPHDPDPVYQSGMCLLELGAYAKGRVAFEEVERLAPGWFRCRSDRWLAEGLESGTISEEEFRLVRILDDGGLPPAQATALVNQAVERFPEFAPLYLFLGNCSPDERDAIAAYRKGLDLVDEPDLESRLLCALAARISADEPERMELVERAVSLNGSLVAVATAKLMRLQ